MKLSSEQIINLTVGAIEAFSDGDGVHFYRSSKAQRDFWLSRSEFLGRGANCTTGVRLDFETDATSIRFRVGVGKYEVLIDGMLRAAYDVVNGDAFEIILTDSLGVQNAVTRVTLTLPSHEQGGVIKEIELVGGSFAIRHKFDKKFLFFGDSITQGWDSEWNALSYAYQVSLHYNAESLVQGIGGAYFHEESFDPLDFEPDAVFVAYGTNDFTYYQTMEEIRNHTAKFLRRAAECYKGKKLVCMTPTWRGDVQNMPCGSFQAVRTTVAEEAKKLAFYVVDGLTLIPPMDKFFLPDRLHPNALGFSLYANNLIAQLDKLI